MAQTELQHERIHITACAQIRLRSGCISIVRSVFFVFFKQSYLQSTKRRPWSNCAQADTNLCWVHAIRWATIWENIPSNMCAQQRLNSNCTSALCRWESSLSTWRNFASLAMQNVPSEDFDQTARVRSLIWIFAGHTSEGVFSDTAAH